MTESAMGSQAGSLADEGGGGAAGKEEGSSGDKLLLAGIVAGELGEVEGAGLGGELALPD